MAIAFECGCGKGFRVGDELAGKRTKCPSCGAGLTVPGGSAEDEAFKLLSAGPDPEPVPARYDPPPPPPRSAPPPVSPQASTAAAAAMRAVKEKEATAPRRRERQRSEYSGISLSPGMIGGLVSMALAGVWMAIALSSNRIPIYAPILFVFGLVAVVRGLLGLSED